MTLTHWHLTDNTKTSRFCWQLPTCQLSMGRNLLVDRLTIAKLKFMQIFRTVLRMLTESMSRPVKSPPRPSESLSSPGSKDSTHTDKTKCLQKHPALTNWLLTIVFLCLLSMDKLTIPQHQQNDKLHIDHHAHNTTHAKYANHAMYGNYAKCPNCAKDIRRVCQVSMC